MNVSDFTVAERPLFMVDDKTDLPARVPEYKALYRTDTGQVLSVVKNSYRVIQNEEVFDAVEQNIVQALGHSRLANAKLEDGIAKDGLLSMRSWVFPDIRVQSTTTSKSDIAFRIVAINGFGGISVKCFYGGVDFYCLNGLIVGEDYGALAFRHTTKHMDTGVRFTPIRDSLEQFEGQSKVWLRWQNTYVEHENVMVFLSEKVESDSLLSTLENQIINEYAHRGQTLWAVYSALTFYASHNEGFFAVSELAKGNEAAVMLRRQNAVKRMVNSPQWKEMDIAA